MVLEPQWVAIRRRSSDLHTDTTDGAQWQPAASLAASSSFSELRSCVCWQHAAPSQPPSFPPWQVGNIPSLSRFTTCNEWSGGSVLHGFSESKEKTHCGRAQGNDVCARPHVVLGHFSDASVQIQQAPLSWSRRSHCLFVSSRKPRRPPTPALDAIPPATGAEERCDGE